jgi:hypothetical protein
MSEIEFIGGWKPSSLEKKALHSAVYGWSVYLPIVTASLEKSLPFDPRFIEWYNQGNRNACVGYSWTAAQASVNLNQNGAQHYDAYRLYCEACRIDNDPNTSCTADRGTYLWAGGDVLRNNGPYTDKWDLEQGIELFYWVTSINEARAAFAANRPLIWGVPWFQSWLNTANLIDRDGEKWLKPHSQWGSQIAGGHAIRSLNWSDSRGAFKLVNTWGAAYPDVWVTFENAEYLWKIGAECAVPIDKDFQPPAPDPEPPDEALVYDQIVHQEGGSIWQAIGVEMERVK